MFSGKTSMLINYYTQWNNINKKVLMINYIDDNRYGDDNCVYSHNKIKVPCVKTKLLKDLSDNIINDVDVILINEGQFFSDLVYFSLFWCEKYNKNIIVSGLDGDYLRRPFGQLHHLIPFADDVIKLKAFCKKCNNGTPAIFTKRLSNESEDIVIGTDNYVPLCRKHYNESL